MANLQKFVRTTNGFNYVYETVLGPGEEVIIEMPAVSANKRGINDIGWQADGDVELYGTLFSHPTRPEALWQIFPHWMR